MSLDKSYSTIFRRKCDEEVGNYYTSMPASTKAMFLASLTKPAYQQDYRLLEDRPFTANELLGEYQQLCMELLDQQDFLLNIVLDGTIPLPQWEEFHQIVQKHRKLKVANN